MTGEWLQVSDEKFDPMSTVNTCYPELPWAGSQCGLSGTVGSDNGYPRVKTNVDVDALQQDLVRRVSEGNLIQLQQRRRNLFGLWELECLRFIRFRRRKFGELDTSSERDIDVSTSS